MVFKNLKGGLSGSLGGRLRGADGGGLQTAYGRGLVVKLRSGQVQVLLRLQLEFNSLELDSEVRRLVCIIYGLEI